jgi:hypothetical protein
MNNDTEKLIETIEKDLGIKLDKGEIEMKSEERKEHNKWKSRRWLITLWSMIMVSALSVLGIIFKNDSYVPLATTLVAVPVGFVSLETLNKKHMNKKD